MSDETKQVDEFLGDLKHESNIDPFDNAQDDVFNTTEKKEETSTGNEAPVNEMPKEEKPLPFHQDPRVQKFIDREIERRMSEYEPVVQDNIPTTDSFKEFIDSMKVLVGNDTPEKVDTINKLEKALYGMDEKAAQRALAEIEQERYEELQAEKEAEDQLIYGFEAIQDATGIDLYATNNRKLKGQFIDFIEKISPKDNDGEIIDFPDIPAAFSAFQATQVRASSTLKAKELASRSVDRSGDASITPQVEDKSWDSVDRIFNRLLGK